MKRIGVYILFFLVVMGCETVQEPIKFMLVEKHSGKTPVSFGDNGYIYSYTETYLIENLPKTDIEGRLDKQSYDLEFDFFRKNHKICQLEDDITYSSMYFYRRSSCTEYFIENLEDHTGISQTRFSDCEDDVEYGFFYERDKKNPNNWILHQNLWGKDYHDTIYCDPNRKKVKLPDMPH